MVDESMGESDPEYNPENAGHQTRQNVEYDPTHPALTSRPTQGKKNAIALIICFKVGDNTQISGKMWLGNPYQIRWPIIYN